MSAALRPLNTGELLDRTFSLYRNHYALFLGIVALPHLVLLAFQLAGVALIPRNKGDVLGALLIGLWAIGAGLVSLVVSALSQAATIIAVSQVHLGRPASVMDSFSRVKSKILGVIGLSLLSGIGIGLACLLLLVPGIMLLVRWSLAVPAKVLEDLPVTDAMSRSSQLSEGNRWRIFVVWILFLALSIAVSMLLQWPITFGAIFLVKNLGPTGPLLVAVATNVAAFISQCLVAPLITIAFSLIYYDERVRKEAFDIQLMMTTLDAQQLQPAPA
ncbi:MAG TPA: glycerophosphoryl diester phosphodiesterase membrane domain-containing protein [Terriglobales bacterium]|nr:glycerophosphoryl diester phosphodiesterase membrane domain-containing protein [Terriglobales bacterium]